MLETTPSDTALESAVEQVTESLTALESDELVLLDTANAADCAVLEETEFCVAFESAVETG